MSSPPSPQADPPRARTPWLGFAIVGCGAAIAPLDFAVNVAFPAMTQAFALATPDIRWVAVCYVITYGSLMLFCGVLGDRLGHLRVFRWGLVLSALALTGCAAAPAYGWLLAARVVQGVGVALTLSCAPALAMRLLGEGQRTRALSIYGAMFAASGLLAPFLGGLSMRYAGWSGVYSFRVPIVLLACLCTPWLVRHLRPQILCAPGQDNPSGSVMGLWRLMRRNADFAGVNLASVGVQFCSFTVALSLPYALPAAGWTDMHSGAMLSLWALGVLAGSGVTPILLWRMDLRGVGNLALLAMALGLTWAGALSMTQTWPFMALALWLQGLGLGVFQVAYAEQVVATLPDSARGLSGSLTLVTRTVGIVGAAMFWLWLMDVLQTRALAHGASSAQAIWASTLGLMSWAGGLVGVMVLWRVVRSLHASR
jgi:MFS family permease